MAVEDVLDFTFLYFNYELVLFALCDFSTIFSKLQTRIPKIESVNIQLIFTKFKNEI